MEPKPATRRVDATRRALVCVVVLDGACLVLRLCVWDLGVLVFFLRLIAGCAGLFTIMLSLAALNWREGAVSALPLGATAIAVALWFGVPWERAYMETVWLFHHRQYEAVVAELGESWRKADRKGIYPWDIPSKWKHGSNNLGAEINSQDNGPLPNVYFHVYGGTLMDWRTFGFLYTPADAATLRRYWGYEPPSWTLMKPQWFMVKG